MSDEEKEHVFRSPDYDSVMKHFWISVIIFGLMTVIGIFVLMGTSAHDTIIKESIQSIDDNNTERETVVKYAGLVAEAGENGIYRYSLGFFPLITGIIGMVFAVLAEENFSRYQMKTNLYVILRFLMFCSPVMTIGIYHAFIMYFE